MNFDLFTDFSKPAMLGWLADLGLFVRRPKQFLSKIGAQPGGKLFSRYLFYFVIYTFSYLLTTGANDFRELVRPSILDLFICLPIVLLLTLISKIATCSAQTRNILFFVLTLYLVAAPINLLLFSLYINHENYLFLYLNGFFGILTTGYLFYGFGWIVQSNRWRSLRTMFVTLLALSLIFVGIERIAIILRKGEFTFSSPDFIGEEYQSLVSGVTFQDRLPVVVQQYRKGYVVSVLGLKGFNKDNVFITDSLQLASYHQAVKTNIRLLQSKQEQIKFLRNKHAAGQLLAYNQLLDEILTTVPQFAVALSGPGSRDSTYNIVMENQLIVLKTNVKDYHNSICKTHRLYQAISHAQTVMLFWGGYLAESWTQPDKIVYPDEGFDKFD